MTTFERGKAPAWACATWTRGTKYFKITTAVPSETTYVSASINDDADLDRLCRALSLAKLAEDWAADLDEAARAALLKACAE